MNSLTQTPKNCAVKPMSVFKSPSAFESATTLVCYIDKHGKSYTKQDFLNLSGNNEHLARMLFDTVITKAPVDVVNFWKSKEEFPF
jgi:hypothetical protein